MLTKWASPSPCPTWSSLDLTPTLALVLSPLISSGPLSPPLISWVKYNAILVILYLPLTIVPELQNALATSMAEAMVEAFKNMTEAKIQIGSDFLLGTSSFYK